MKKMKKIASLVLALILALSLAVPAFAADDETCTITITGAAGHTYEVYQIFTGTVYKDANGNEYLNDAVYGKNYGSTGEAVSADTLNAFTKMSGMAVAKALQEDLIGDPYATVTGDSGTGNAILKDVPAGYYLIIDVTEGLPEYDADGNVVDNHSAYILQVVGDATVASKHTSVPEFIKKIDDENDSVVDDPATRDVDEGEDAIEWHDSADHDIGDLINYKLAATIPSEYSLFVDNGVAYPFTFHDVEEQGLTFQPGTVKVYVDGTEINKNYYDVVTPGATHDEGYTCTFEVKFEDLTKISDVKPGSVIEVRYQSELNENAVIGSEGNVNKARGEFRRYGSPETPEFTPWDSVIAFTYTVEVNKVDPDGEPLAGAKFTLEKFVAAEDGTETYKDTTGNWTALKTVEAEPDTVFTFKGLDDGYYRLTETEAPNGYNKIDPIYFTVVAEHDILWETQEREDVLTKLSGNHENGTVLFTHDPEKYETEALVGTIENNQGTKLPETGGIGTTIFYALGAVLVLGAVVLLVTKKRMSDKA